MTKKPVLVLGGTGRSGRRVADRLRRSGVPTRVASRRGGPPFYGDDPSPWDGALTSARLLSMGAAAREITFASGHRVEYLPGTVEGFIADAGLDGIPEDDARPLAGLFESILDGRNATTAAGATA